MIRESRWTGDESRTWVFGSINHEYRDWSLLRIIYGARVINFRRLKAFGIA